MTRALAPLLLAALGIACGERAPAAPPPSEPAPAPPEAPRDPRCMALCEHSAACLDARGVDRSDAERDCAGSCRPGGLYAAMPDAALACSAHADCDVLDACTAAALDLVLGDPPAARAPAAEEHPVLQEWPAELPSIPGGTPLPTTDPFTLARVAYPGAPEGLESLLRAELDRARWAAGPTTIGENALRFSVRRGDTELGIAIYTDQPGRSVVQIFGFDDPRP